MKAVLLSFLSILLFSLLAPAQSDGSWTTMSRKDAEKILTDSPWARTQTDTDVSEMFYSPTKPGSASISRSATTAVGRTNDQQGINNNRADQGATNQAVSINYHVRLLSAKPVREAIARMVLLENVQSAEDVGTLMQPFVDRNFSQYIVVSLVFDSTDGRYSGPALQALSSATAETLRNKTYLERKDGKRLYLMDYRVPLADGLGAKFVFERSPGGKPFIDGDSGNFRFYSEVGDKLKLNVKYEISELKYKGVVEY